jgi:hypothetical protein
MWSIHYGARFKADRVQPLMPRAICRRMHPYLDLDPGFRDRKLSSEGRHQHGSCFKGIRYLFAPRGIPWLHVVAQSDLDCVAAVVFANACEQVSVPRIACFRFHKKRAGPHQIATPSAHRNGSKYSNEDRGNECERGENAEHI